VAPWVQPHVHSPISEFPAWCRAGLIQRAAGSAHLVGNWWRRWAREGRSTAPSQHAMSAMASIDRLVQLLKRASGPRKLHPLARSNQFDGLSRH